MVVIRWFLPRYLVWLWGRWPFVRVVKGKELHDLRKREMHARNYGGGDRVA